MSCPGKNRKKIAAHALHNFCELILSHRDNIRPAKATCFPLRLFKLGKPVCFLDFVVNEAKLLCHFVRLFLKCLYINCAHNFYFGAACPLGKAACVAYKVTVCGNSDIKAIPPCDKLGKGALIRYGCAVCCVDFGNKLLKAGYAAVKLSNKLCRVLCGGFAKHDPENKYAMPYLWATTGIGYNVDKVKAVLGKDAPVDSWDLVLKPENLEKLKSCGVSFLDAPEEIFATVLNYLGKDPNSSKADDYTGPATDLLLKLRPNIRYFHSSQYINDLANGDICVAIGWAGDVWQAANRAKEAKNGVNVSYFIPKEGALAFFDVFAMPADAKNKDEAYQFLNYLMRPDVIAKISDQVFYANGNKSCSFSYDAKGQRVGTQTYFHENGQKMFEGRWEAGRISGALSIFNEDGRKIMERNYDASGKYQGSQQVALPAEQGSTGKEFHGTGNFTIYDANGRKEQVGQFKNGKLITGARYFYDSMGRLSKTEKYADGKLVGTVRK